MVKLVYTEALKASSPQGECGFDSHSRYQAYLAPAGPRCIENVIVPLAFAGLLDGVQ